MIHEFKAGSPFKSNFLAITFAILIFFLTIPIYYQSGINSTSQPISTDFYKFYLSAHRLSIHKSIYWIPQARPHDGTPCSPATTLSELHQADKNDRLSPIESNPCLNPNLNLPVSMILFKPISRLPFNAAWWTWSCMSFTAMLISISVMLKTLNLNKNTEICWTLAASAVVLATFPAIENHMLGQLGFITLLPLTMAWRSATQKQDLRAGLWLGLAIGMKPFLILIPAGYLFTRRWEILKPMGATIAASILVGAMLCGTQSYNDYWLVSQNINWTDANWNASWTGWLDRAFNSQKPSNLPDNKWLAHSIALACGAMTTLWFAWLARKTKKSNMPAIDDMIFAIGPATSLLVSPLGWAYYFPIIYFGIFIGLKRAMTNGISRVQAISATGIWLFLCVPVSVKVAPGPSSPADWVGMDSWYNYLAIAMLVLICKLGRF
jgi:hypothetical protein